MNTKRILLLIIMFLFLMIAGLNNIYATDINNNLGIDNNIISDELKPILNEEGKLVVTDTTMAEDKLTFLNEYVSKYNVDGGYWFEVSNYNEADSTCYISIHGRGGQTVDVVFGEEVISDEFKTILKDGKIHVLSSTKIGVVDIINSYFYKLADSNEEYQFRVATYGVLNEEESTEEDKIYDEVPYIDENCTKVTIQMRDKNWKLLEQHIVEISYLTEKSDAFKKELNKEGKLVFNSVKPKTPEEFWGLYELLFMMNNEEKGYGFGYESEDYSSVNFTINYGTDKEETHRVEIEYNYNKGIDKKFQEFRNNFPEDIEYFQVRDLELINYWVNNVENDDSEHLDQYSGELKALVKNSNIKYYVDNRAGWGSPFEVGRKGIAIFKFKDIVYYINSYLGTEAEYVIYVPNETVDTKEEIMAAAQRRIDKYLKKQENIQATISYAGTAWEANVRYWYEIDKENGELENPNITFEEYLSKFSPEVDENFGIDGVNVDDDSFIITIKVGDKEKKFNVIIKRDSSKMVTPSYKTVDMETDIEINSDDSSIPLDTHIKAEKVTDGKEYERILKILDLKENEMFDLKLYSDTLEDYIKKLPNGEFEVRIPISEDFKHKDLKAYYVDENGKVEKYDITKKDGYAIFRTNHFSIYTLAEEKVETYKLILNANGGKFSDGKAKLEFDDVTKCDMTKVEKPVKDGYTFKGWYTKKAGGISINTVMNGEAGIQKDTTFYAQWKKVLSVEEEIEIPEVEDEEDNNNTGNTDSENTSTGNTNTGIINDGNTNAGMVNTNNTNVGANNNIVTENNNQTGNNIVMLTVISSIVFAGIVGVIKAKKYFK